MSMVRVTDGKLFTENVTGTHEHERQGQSSVIRATILRTAFTAALQGEVSSPLHISHWSRFVIAAPRRPRPLHTRTTSSSGASTPALSQPQTQTYCTSTSSPPTSSNWARSPLRTSLGHPYQEHALQEIPTPVIRSTTMRLLRHYSSSVTTRTAVRR